MIRVHAQCFSIKTPAYALATRDLTLRPHTLNSLFIVTARIQELTRAEFFIIQSHDESMCCTSFVFFVTKTARMTELVSVSVVSPNRL